MARLNNAPSANTGSPVAAHRGHTARPSVTKEEIQEFEKEIVEAKKMVEVSVESRNAKALQREQEALKKIRESEEFQAKVESFRWKLVSSVVPYKHLQFTDTSQLAEEARLPPKSELGKKLAKVRIEKRVNGFKANLEREMFEEQAAKAARELPKSPKIYKSSVPLHVYKATSPTPQERKKQKTPRKPSGPRSASSIEKMTTALGDRVPLELSPTGFAYFSRHDKDDDDWERVSQHSIPIAATAAQVEGTQETQHAHGDQKMGTPVRSMFKGLFGGK
jgi:hypothetical protein